MNPEIGQIYKIRISNTQLHNIPFTSAPKSVGGKCLELISLNEIVILLDIEPVDVFGAYFDMNYKVLYNNKIGWIVKSKNIKFNNLFRTVIVETE